MANILDFKTLEHNLISHGDNGIEEFELCPENYDYLGIYFSAHWCPPCRGFTPKLATFYKKQKEENGGKLEIIFCSSDRDDSAFDSYFAEMPWKAIKFDKGDIMNELNQKYDVEGIPTLVIVDKDGQLVNKDAYGWIEDEKLIKDWEKSVEQEQSNS